MYKKSRLEIGADFCGVYTCERSGMVDRHDEKDDRGTIMWWVWILRRYWSHVVLLPRRLLVKWFSGYRSTWS